VEAGSIFLVTGGLGGAGAVLHPIAQNPRTPDPQNPRALPPPRPRPTEPVPDQPLPDRKPPYLLTSTGRVPSAPVRRRGAAREMRAWVGPGLRCNSSGGGDGVLLGTGTRRNGGSPAVTPGGAARSPPGLQSAGEPLLWRCAAGSGHQGSLFHLQTRRLIKASLDVIKCQTLFIKEIPTTYSKYY